MSKEKVEIVAKKMLENAKLKTGKKSMGKIMEEAGYKRGYAKNPQDITKTKVWDKVLTTILSDERLGKVHDGLLNAGTIMHYEFPDPENKPSMSKEKKKEKKPITDEEIKEIIESVPGCKLIYIKRGRWTDPVAYFRAPDERVVKDALEMAYKLKGKFAPEKVEITDPNAKSLADIDNDIKEAEKELNIGAKKAKK